MVFPLEWQCRERCEALSKANVGPKIGRWPLGPLSSASPRTGSGNAEPVWSDVPKWAVSPRLLLTLFGLVATGVALGILGVEPQVCVGVALGGAAIIGAASSVSIGLAAIMIGVSLFQREELFSFSIPLFEGGLKPTDLLLVATLAGWAVRSCLRTGRHRPVPRSVLVIVLSFVTWGVGSVLLGVLRGNYYKYGLTELRPLLLYLLVLAVVAELGELKVRWLVHATVATGLVVATKAVILFAQGAGSLATYTQGSVRIRSVSFDCILVALVFCLALGATMARAWPYLVSAAVLSAGLIVTFQRAAFLALVLVLGFFVVYIRGRQRLRLSLVCVGVVTIGLGIRGVQTLTGQDATLLGALTTRLASIGAYRTDVSAGHRLQEWSRAWEMIQDHPILGNGLGAEIDFLSPMYNEVDPTAGYWSHDTYMHNSYLWFLTKMGVIGIVLFAALIGLAGGEVRRQLRAASSGSSYDLTVALGGALIAQLVTSVFFPMFNVDDTVPFVVLLLGGIFSLGLPQASGWRPSAVTWPS